MDKWKGWSLLTFAFLFYTFYVTVTFFFMHDYSNRDQIKGQTPPSSDSDFNIEYDKNLFPDNRVPDEHEQQEDEDFNDFSLLPGALNIPMKQRKATADYLAEDIVSQLNDELNRFHSRQGRIIFPISNVSQSFTSLIAQLELESPLNPVNILALAYMKLFISCTQSPSL